MNLPEWVVAGAVAYLCGSVPFALLIGLSRGVDIRKQGSGNVGATNCGRVAGKKWGLLSFVLDVLKGVAPVLGAGYYFGLLGGGGLSAAEAGLWLGVAILAVLGHVFPLWLGFKGGKGVATGFGVILAVYPYLTWPAVAACLTWLLFASTLRYVGLSSVIAALLLPAYFGFAMALRGWEMAWAWPFFVATGLMAALLTVRHKGNLARTWAGTEPRLGG
ncbi:MAG: glycerol-3-phosphate 1-O-acyltransferase PlsY [Planctomycetota bacterium]